MYELIILAHLMRQPVHGYLIAKVINDIIGPFARISNGRLYPLLSKLEQSGLIAAHVETERQQGDRQLRVYEITEAGKRRFHELMLDTTMNPGEYQKIFLQKICFLEFLQPEERLWLLDHYVNYCQIHILHLTSELEGIANQASSWGPGWDTRSVNVILHVVQHTVDQWQLELSWAKDLREREMHCAQEE